MSLKLQNPHRHPADFAPSWRVTHDGSQEGVRRAGANTPLNVEVDGTGCDPPSRCSRERHDLTLSVSVTGWTRPPTTTRKTRCYPQKGFAAAGPGASRPTAPSFWSVGAEPSSLRPPAHPPRLPGSFPGPGPDKSLAFVVRQDVNCRHHSCGIRADFRRVLPGFGRGSDGRLAKFHGMRFAIELQRKLVQFPAHVLISQGERFPDRLGMHLPKSPHQPLDYATEHFLGLQIAGGFDSRGYCL